MRRQIKRRKVLKMSNLLERMYSVSDHRRERHFQLPKELFENDFYECLSFSAKTIYSILSDRQELSRRNGELYNDWIDENGKIYFYFDVEKLAKYCSLSKSSIIRYKKELQSYDLLYEVRQGQGKPNRMYILKVKTKKEVKSVDNTQKCQIETSRSVKLNNLEVSNLDTNDTEFKDTKRIFMDDNENSVIAEGSNWNRKDIDYPLGQNDPMGKHKGRDKLVKKNKPFNIFKKDAYIDKETIYAIDKYFEYQENDYREVYSDNTWFKIIEVLSETINYFKLEDYEIEAIIERYFETDFDNHSLVHFANREIIKYRMLELKCRTKKEIDKWREGVE